jgi:phage terminase large subunit
MSGTDDAWRITDKYIEHKVTESVFLFKGMNVNSRSIKSFAQADIAWIEEAEDISQKSWTDLDPTIRKDGAEIWCLFNPRDRSSVMAQTFLENPPPPSTIIMNGSYLDNPYLSPAVIAQADHMRMTNPVLYRHVWLGEYLDSSQTSLVTNAVIGDDAPMYDNDRVVVGVDVAMDGGDKTVFYIRKGRRILERQSFLSMDRETLVHELKMLIHKYKPHRINVDSTGHGAWVPQMLEGSGIIVHGVNFSESAIKDDKYSNRRTELYGEANEFFRNGGKLPTGHGDTIIQLENSKYKIDHKSRFQLLPKPQIKRLLGCSPDDSDAFVLCLYDPDGMFAPRNVTANIAKPSQIAVKNLISASKWTR